MSLQNIKVSMIMCVYYAEEVDAILFPRNFYRRFRRNAGTNCKQQSESNRVKEFSVCENSFEVEFNR